MNLALFLGVLAVLILSHEFGHFIVARLFGVKVEEFGLGFPPRLYGKKIGETFYSFNLIPFGGFVKILGEDSPAKRNIQTHDDPVTSRHFYDMSRPIQAAIVAAGIFFNLLLAWVLFTVGYSVGLPTSVHEGNRQYINNPSVLITSVKNGSPAEAGGLKVGEELMSVSQGSLSIQVREPADLQKFIEQHGTESFALSIRNRKLDKVRNVELRAREGIVGGKMAIGISMDLIGDVSYPILRAVREGFKETAVIAVSTFYSMILFFRDIFVGASYLGDITGPVGIVRLVGEAGTLGFGYLVSLVAVISINLAVINVLPIPSLDGGRLLFIAIESIKRSPIPPQISRAIHSLGFAFLLALMAAITYSDVIQLIQG